MSKTYRDVYLWGDKHEEKLDQAYFRVIKQVFGLSDNDLRTEHSRVETKLDLPVSTTFIKEHLPHFEKLLGTDNIDVSAYGRASHAFGKYYTELLELRQGNIPIPPDIVVYPQNKDDVLGIVAYCNDMGIPLIPFGAGSSVTGALQTPMGGVSVDLSKNMNKILSLNETNFTVTVEAGILGPTLEEYLNEKGFTCGHFPQSFEYSTVGGWVAAKGAGQASTGYGKIEHIVVALSAITPVGEIVTKDYPAAAQGWDIHPLFFGSEGSLGVITSVTLKLHQFRPKNTRYASFIFKDFESGTEAMRHMIQAEYGRPHLFRISDPQETAVAFTLKEYDGTLSDKVLNILGYTSGERCLMFVTVEGDEGYTTFVKNKLRKTARKFGGFYIGKGPVKHWLNQRFHSAYLRDPLMDIGIRTDTLETSATWDNIISLWSAVQDYFEEIPYLYGMAHISHVYTNGANLYFTFLCPMSQNEKDDYEIFFDGLIETILANNGSLSHHHGIGRNLAGWMERQVGRTGMLLNRGIKTTLDPDGIMNPGGNLGLD